MKENIYTIPVTDVFEDKCGCPICKMRDTLEKRSTEYIMGAAMMEPDIRIETNRLGFCGRHFAMMVKQRNRLSLALMLESHLNEVKKNTFKSKLSFFNKKGKVNRIAKLEQSCYICDKIDKAVENMIETILSLYVKDDDFKKLFSQQETLCLPHFRLLCSMAQSRLDKKSASEFIIAASDLSSKYLDGLCGDISKFCKMFDYRNSGPDADWGNSKDSVERALWFLTSDTSFKNH